MPHAEVCGERFVLKARDPKQNQSHYYPLTLRAIDIIAELAAATTDVDISDS
jgi:hypothetical protein